MTQNEAQYDVAIIGAGVAGLYAAYCCKMAGLSCCLIEALGVPGGQCGVLYPEKKICGVPGFVGKTKDFIAMLAEQCLCCAKDMFFGCKVVRMSKTETGHFCIETNDNKQITALHTIIATGIGDMVPNIPSGIDGINDIKSDFIQSYCLDLDLYRGKKIVIVGGGNSAVDFATSIVEIADKVTLVHRRQEFACEPEKLQKLMRSKVDVVLNGDVTRLEEANGSRVVTIKSPEYEKNLEARHIVFCCGFSAKPCQIAWLVELGLEMKNFLIEVNFETMETSVSNCYAIGDVITYANKRRSVVPCFFEADRCVRAVRNAIDLDATIHKS